jgi:arsenate reductase
MKVHGLTTCRQTQKALAWFKAKGIAFEFQNFKKEGISSDKLRDWDAKQGYNVFLNKKSLTWKRLPPSVRESVKTKEDALSLLLEEPGIIKRPVIEDGDFLFWGFDENVYESHFLNDQPVQVAVQ